MVNNFSEIKKLLRFTTNDDFYHLQVIKRKKEHSDLQSDCVIKTFYVTSSFFLDSKQDEIINLCTFHNARAYINLNRRSFEKMAFMMLTRTADLIRQGNFKAVSKAYESVCGSCSNEDQKKFIIDIDSPDFLEEETNELVDFLSELEPVGDKFLAQIPTKNGIHIIAKPFNTQKFKEKYSTTDIHKDNGTILFAY